MSNLLEIWVVCERPSDYPNSFTARKWLAGEKAEPTQELLVADTLTELRQMIPPGLYRMPRMPTDGAEIIETWF